ERLSYRREAARRRATAPAPMLADPVLDGLPVAATRGPPTTELQRPVVLAGSEEVSAPKPTRVMAAVREADADHAQPACASAAEAARRIAADFVQARARAEREWTRPESQRLPVDSGEHERPDDAALVKIGGFAPQFIAPPEPAPTA